MNNSINQNPEQIARDRIDKMLIASGWVVQSKEPVPVEYSQKNPIEQFDFLVVDECHRSIYNL